MSMNIEMARILSDMRQMREMAVQNDVLPKRLALNPDSSSVSDTSSTAPAFGELLGEALEKVNDVRQESAQLTTDYQKGVSGVDLTTVMVAAQKASLATEAVIQVRNKFVQAYEEIMKMPI